MIYLFIYLATLGLCCCAWAFSSRGEQGLHFVAERGLLIVVVSLVTEHRLQAHGLPQLWHVGSVVVACVLQSTDSVVVAHRFSCSAACGIFPDQGSNPCPLHWPADPQPLCHQGSPELLFNSYCLYLKKNFYWSIVDLQCCVSFRCIFSYELHCN